MKISENITGRMSIFKLMLTLNRMRNRYKVDYWIEDGTLIEVEGII